MKITILGAAGFIGTNLSIKLLNDEKNDLLLVDKSKKYFSELTKEKLEYSNYRIFECGFNNETDFDEILKGQDVLYHLVSTTAPSTSNQRISEELQANIIVTTRMLDACVRCGVKKIIFLSSGGTVYGKEVECPLNEETSTYPISSYGIQKITIEKLLYLYNYLHGIEYKVIRLANPYGPFQRPNGVLGAVTTFIYKAIKKEEIRVFGDGTVVRDFIYIDDAIEGILRIANGHSKYSTYNLGSGVGIDLNKLLSIISETLNIDLDITYLESREADVPVNYLDISRYEKDFGKFTPLSLENGIRKTAEFMNKRNVIQ
ncbi:NAD-dependent epimerase/dehydratase family protein [Enterococcus sp. AZ072]|uniref:NAD-dependent epimerase/dehydratase family protein n=1 Tax=unclassified Enterococcus TaxID=2608891 RepID=UPI003D269309